MAWAGGYVGDGVGTTNLAGRTLADLISNTTTTTDLTRMPWVNHVSPNWEPEPLRYLASKAIVSVLGSADRAEDAHDRRARRSRLVAPFLMGH